MYFVDSNTCIYFMNGKYSSIKEKFLAISPKEIKISAVVKSELLLGAFKSQNRERTLEKVEKFLKPFEIIDFTNEMTYAYAELRKDFENEGTPIGSNDMFIAATALHENAILVTHNTDEFSRIKGLKIVDWVVE